MRLLPDKIISGDGLFVRRQREDMSVLAQDYPSANANTVGYANPSSLAKRDARG